MDTLTLCALVATGVVAAFAVTLYFKAEAFRHSATSLELDAAAREDLLRKADTDLAVLRERVSAYEQAARERAESLTKAQQLFNEKSIEYNNAAVELAALKSARVEEQRAFEARMEDLRRIREQLSATFAELSQKALGENSAQFLNLAKENLSKLNEQNAGELEKRRLAVESMVKPLQEALAKVGQRVEDFDKSRDKSFTEMAGHMKTLAEQEDRLRHETASLGEALRKPSVRGAWGEMQLRRVVEFAGMVEHCHFDEQVAVTAQDRPDMIVNLPNGLQVVVDAKAPMQAYLEALQTADTARRDELMQTHVRQIRDRAKLLGQKKYTDQLEHTPDFTVLFLPAESLFSTALTIDPDLLTFGVENRVIIATPTTLISLLMAVSAGWQDKSITENAMQLKSECEMLYANVCTFLGHYSDIGAGLEKAIGAYNKSVGTMQSRVLPRARKIGELGGFDKDDEKLLKKEIKEIAETEPRQIEGAS